MFLFMFIILIVFIIWYNVFYTDYKIKLFNFSGTVIFFLILIVSILMLKNSLYEMYNNCIGKNNSDIGMMVIGAVSFLWSLECLLTGRKMMAIVMGTISTITDKPDMNSFLIWGLYILLVSVLDVSLK